MRFRFDSATNDGLRVIPGIPDITPCLIEGRNGIGKTVAVRLLELIAGRQPYEGAERQWHSLRERLGNTVVRIDEMADGHWITFTFTPEEWSAEGDPPGQIGEWLGTVTLDDAPISVSEAQQLFWVERFAGNEDLERTLRRRTEIYAGNAASTGQAVSASVAALSSLLDPLREELDSVDPNGLAETRVQLEEIQREESETRTRLTDLTERHDNVLHAIEARDSLKAAQDPANVLQERRRDLGTRLSELSKERDDLEARIADTSKALTRQGDVQATLGEAQRILRYRRKRDRNIRSDIERLSSLLEIEPTGETVADALRLASESLRELEERQRDVDAGSMTSRLIDTVAGMLEGDDAYDLNDQTLISLPDRGVTVAEARDGMAQRRHELTEQPRPDELELLTREMSRVQRRVSLLQDLSKRLTELARQQDRIDEAESEAKHAEEAVERAGKRDEQYRGDNQRLGAVEEEIDAVSSQLTEIHAALGLEGGRSPEDAATDLASRLTLLGISDAGGLDELEREVRNDVSDARHALKRLAEHAAALRRSAAVMSASVEAAMTAVRTDERFEWMRDLLPAETDSTLEVFAHLRGRLTALVDELEATRDVVQVVGELASGALAPQPMVSDVQLNDAVKGVLAEELRRGLDTPEIRKWLFGGASVESIDLTRRELVLAGHDAPRAFDTFSTGEQAFAYTQARILELEVSARPNRLLILDEFGAFVAADRMPDLASFLRSDEVSSIADQVLVILPLQSDYEAELKETTGDLRRRFEARAGQLKERDYYVQQLEA